MSSYRGGSTTIRGGKFISYDPADDGQRINLKHKNSDKKAKSTSQKSGGRNVVKRKRKSNISKIDKTDPRIELLHQVVAAEVYGVSHETPNRRMTDSIEAEIKEAGDILTWARKQLKYQAIYDKKTLMRARRAFKKRQMVEAAGENISHNPKPSSGVVEIEVSRRSLEPSKRPPKAHGKTEALRVAAIQSLIAYQLEKSSSAALPKIDPIFFDEMKAAGGPITWAKAQPRYGKMLQKKINKEKVKINRQKRKVKKPIHPAIRKEDISSLTDEEILERGQRRVTVYSTSLMEADLHTLMMQVGALPPPPPQSVSLSKVGKQRLSRQIAWHDLMSPRQKTAWQYLDKNKKLEYFAMGHVTLGKRSETNRKGKVEPLSDPPVSYILEQMNKVRESTLDPKKIDWDTT